MLVLDREVLILHKMENLGNRIYAERGQLLVASPGIVDPFFSRSVVFLLESDIDKGHIGLVLNHAMPLTMADLVPVWEDGKRWVMYNGGPVEMSRLFMLHTMGDRFRGSHEIAPGIFVGGKLKDVTEHLQREEADAGEVRFFLGYSGWEKGQLEAEIEAGDWAVKDITDPELLLEGDGSRYWRREVLELGTEYRHWSVMPETPQIN